MSTLRACIVGFVLPSKSIACCEVGERWCRPSATTTGYPLPSLWGGDGMGVSYLAGAKSPISVTSPCCPPVAHEVMNVGDSTVHERMCLTARAEKH